MANCPRCQQRLKGAETACPRCGMEVTAYGHPGIPLHRAGTDDYLCDTCVYELDDSCSFPQRPEATSCTLYRDCRQPVRSHTSKQQSRRLRLSFELRSQLWLLAIICIIVIAVLLAR
ncbi:MAG: zinc ribbon domain-containing protein [Thermosynechococcaceae cyanobacterium]